MPADCLGIPSSTASKLSTNPECFRDPTALRQVILACSARFGPVRYENTRVAARRRDLALDRCREPELTAGAHQGQLHLDGKGGLEQRGSGPSGFPLAATDYCRWREAVCKEIAGSSRGLLEHRSALVTPICHEVELPGAATSA